MRDPTLKFPARSATACLLAAQCAIAGVQETDVWMQIPAAPAPPAPLGGAMVRNDAHGLVLFVGASAIPWNNCVYQFDGVAWTPRALDEPTSLPKATRFAATGATGRGYSLIFGGVVSGAYSNTTIAFDGHTFHERAAEPEVNPPARADAALAYLEPSDVVVLFGGTSDSGLLNDTWMYNGEIWTPHLGQYAPSPRKGHAMAYDPIREVVLMYGGTTADGPSNETWAFNGTNWYLYTEHGPSPRSGHAMFFDEGRGRVVLVGGLPQDPGVEVAQTWEWTGTNWQIIDSQGPTPRIGAAAAYDSERGVAVLFGGISPAATLLNDTWEFELSSPFGPGIETPVGLRPTDIAAGHFDDDQFPDVVVTDSLRASIFYFRNLGVDTGGVPRGSAGSNGWNGFAEPLEMPVSGAPGKVEAVDLNKDGRVDIIVAIPGGGDGKAGSEYFLGDGLGGFSGANTLLDQFGQDDVQPGDLDNVKDYVAGLAPFTDLAYVSTANGIVGVVEGNPTGFNPPIVLEVGGEPTRVALGDLDGDGLADLVYTNRAAGTVVVIVQQSNGKVLFDPSQRIDFPAGLPGSQPVALVLFDFDGDADLDVAVADAATNSVTALANLGTDGKGGWQGLVITDITPTGANPVSIEAASFFGSGLQDISTANESGNTISVLRNLGGGLFADPIDLGVTQGPVALSAADLNADGLEDLVAASAPPAPPGILTSFLALGLTPCPGDADGDRFVGFKDLTILLQTYGTVGITLQADFNGNGIVDFEDLNQLLTLFGVTCP